MSETPQLIPTEVGAEEEGKCAVSGQWGGGGKGTSLGVVVHATCRPSGHQGPHRPHEPRGQSLQGWRGTGGSTWLVSPACHF